MLYLRRASALTRKKEESRVQKTTTEMKDSDDNKKIRVGINGFGRIGRLAFRLAFESDDSNLEFVHVNEGVGSGESSAYLANWDSVHGPWRGCNVEFDEKTETMRVVKENDDGSKTTTVMTYSQKMSPGEVDWKSKGIDMVLECSGEFLTREKLQAYFDQGVKKVVVSAPVKDAKNPVLNYRLRREPFRVR